MSEPGGANPPPATGAAAPVTKEHTVRPAYRWLAGFLAVASLPSIPAGIYLALGKDPSTPVGFGYAFLAAGVFGAALFGTAAVRGWVPDWLFNLATRLGLSLIKGV